MKIKKILLLSACILGLSVTTVTMEVNHNSLNVAAKSKATKTYQNPKKYHQIHATRVKPHGTVGHNIGVGYEGIKTYKVMKKLGTYNGYNKYNYATKSAVKRFQKRHHIKATGRVNYKTWVKLGLKKAQWKSIDSYTAPLYAKKTQGRKAHVEATIKQAKRYLGNSYLVGSSSKPFYGVDCSGLVIQALYAGGISPLPVSSIRHGYPGNEWNSRNLFKDKGFKHVKYAHRKRGDLIFYYQPGTKTIWHVALYLGKNKVIESWPPKVMIQPIKNWQRSKIAGVARPFL